MAVAIAADIINHQSSSNSSNASSLLIPTLPLYQKVGDEAVISSSNNSNKNTSNDDGALKHSSKTKEDERIVMKVIHDCLSQLPAIIVVSTLIFMMGIPFGAAFFPTELALPNKEIIGLRMFLFATFISQLVFTYQSKFTNCIGLQMIENVPFYIALARILLLAEHDVEDDDEKKSEQVIISTLFFLFGLSSIIVGCIFYLLGKFEMGRILYFFPKHVLVGCIGGIGLFIIITSVEVATSTTLAFTVHGMYDTLILHVALLVPVLVFEVMLRLLMHLTTKNGIPKFPLLGPIYYLCITPIFYIALHYFGISLKDAEEGGYFFPPFISSGSVYNKELFDIFTSINPALISWKSVIKCIPTVLGLAAFSLIHVPINIPAFAISTNVEPDMNAELIAHGASNALSGIFGGLQNYLAYSPSVVYMKSSGGGKWSSLSVAGTTLMIFIYGPTIASYVPRCMAGTLLLHLGIDCFIEGGIESYYEFDTLEYSGICLIMIVMVTVGMDEALVVGMVAALSTYVAQSIAYQDPIRGAMSASRLRSSAWERSIKAQRILLDRKTGRSRIYIFHLQGHLFFGNAVKLSADVKQRLIEKRQSGNTPICVILDFCNVVGIDSSAAQSIVKLKSFIQKNFNVKILLLVTGTTDGLRCNYGLSQKFVDELGRKSIHVVTKNSTPLIKETRRISLAGVALVNLKATEEDTVEHVMADIPNSQVFHTIDDALVFAEDVLIALEDPTILQTDCSVRFPLSARRSSNTDEVKSILENLLPEASENEIETIQSLLTKETYHKDDVVWEQGGVSTSLKVVVRGSLISLLEDGVGDATGIICVGATIGELGLVNDIPRMTTVKVLSDEATLYSLSREKWICLTEDHPKVARYIDMLVIRYLHHRIQHVSNNVFDRRSLPV
jgi:SulP family sulfate permease